MTRGRGRRSRDPDAGLAECRGRGRRHRRQAGHGADGFRQRWLDARSRSARGRDQAERTRALFVDVAVQPDRLDRDARRTAMPCLRSRGNMVSGSSPTKSMRASGMAEGARAPSFYDVMDARRPHPLRQYVLQELGDDRLAHRLDRGASVARPGDRKPDPVFDLGRRPIHATRRRGRDSSSGEGFVAHQIDAPARAARSRATALAATGRCRFAVPQARSTCSSRSTVKPIRANWRSVLLMLRGSGWRRAPRSEPAGRDFLRLCFARNAEELERAMGQLAAALAPG